MTRTSIGILTAFGLSLVSLFVYQTVSTEAATPIKLPPLGYPESFTRGIGKSLAYEFIRDKWGQIEDRTLRVRNKGGTAWTNPEVTLTQEGLLFSCRPVATVPAHGLLEIALVTCVSDQTGQPIDVDRPVRGLRIVADEGRAALNIEPGFRIAPVK
jgi:hypothetical protein